MAVTTTNYGTLDKPTVQGGRLIVQAGSAKFVAKAKVVTLTVLDINTALYVGLGWKKVQPKEASGIVLYCSGTITAAGKLTVSRATLGGTSSGANFWYQVIGY